MFTGVRQTTAGSLQDHGRRPKVTVGQLSRLPHNDPAQPSPPSALPHQRPPSPDSNKETPLPHFCIGSFTLLQTSILISHLYTGVLTISTPLSSPIGHLPYMSCSPSDTRKDLKVSLVRPANPVHHLSLLLDSSPHVNQFLHILDKVSENLCRHHSMRRLPQNMYLTQQ